ncbi:MAG: hypothetical protein J6S67_18415 [Methanobrevibacter sp.]|nr:hypothetical protein [Methanobrevibacter sp.]
MSRKIAVTSLNASTIDIINTIRANASMEYQSLVPQITQAQEIPKVGEILYGYPALANQFLNALINRIALVRVKSATFNNAYAELKKGYLEFGETVEEVFVNIAKAREFSAEKAESREFKRTLPDVRTAFHAMNWRVQYPVTIQDEDLRMAFMSAEGVQDLIARIVDSVYTASEYDEYLLFKYLMIKAISHGKMYPVSIGTGSDMKEGAKAYRGASNKLTFISDKYNADGVHTNTSKDDQFIFMDADYNASYDVEVLASAFNMDKADFMGRLKLIDDWTTFDNDRFEVIRANSDMIESVTAEELALMANVKAVLVDREWFQIYDNQNKFTETYVASGEYWNYFYNVWKTVSSSPFSNAIVFVTTGANTTMDATKKVKIVDKSEGKEGLALSMEMLQGSVLKPIGGNAEFVQNRDATVNGIGVKDYGALLVPLPLDALTASAIDLDMKVNGENYSADNFNVKTAKVGDEITFTKDA